MFNRHSVTHILFSKMIVSIYIVLICCTYINLQLIGIGLTLENIKLITSWFGPILLLGALYQIQLKNYLLAIVLLVQSIYLLIRLYVIYISISPLLFLNRIFATTEGLSLFKTLSLMALVVTILLLFKKELEYVKKLYTKIVLQNTTQNKLKYVINPLLLLFAVACISIVMHVLNWNNYLSQFSFNFIIGFPLYLILYLFILYDGIASRKWLLTVSAVPFLIVTAYILYRLLTFKYSIQSENNVLGWFFGVNLTLVVLCLFFQIYYYFLRKENLSEKTLPL